MANTMLVKALLDTRIKATRRKAKELRRLPHGERMAAALLATIGEKPKRG